MNQKVIFKIGLMRVLAKEYSGAKTLMDAVRIQIRRNRSQQGTPA